jgi:ribulose-5-phosphate 4-epimerase/fuculose-1-phosphate aldolase
MNDVLCTRQNYPCGTRELAEEVVSLLAQADDPSRSAIGLKNHGLTITGRSLDEVFDRIRGKLLTEVPMFG